MNVYNEVGSGGLSASGCVVVFERHVFITAFGAGDIVYNVAKARRGILEKLVIKLVRPVNSRRAIRRNQVIYQDTFNGLWNEDDLVPYRTALVLAEAYWQRVLDDASQLSEC